MLKFKSYALALVTIFCLSACASKGAVEYDIAELQSLSRADVSSVGSITGIRLEAIRDTALSLGARGGLAWRSAQLNSLLSKNERELERIFNFHALLLDHSVLPPVLIQGNQILNISDTNNIRLADRTYQIAEQAKFVTLPPTWRDYLWLSFSNPLLPDQSLLPKNEDERTIWRRYIREGWEAGILQANSIFSENLGRIKRDFNGMLLYRTLLAQHIVSEPFVAETKLGITGDGNALNINDRVLKITALPVLQSNSGAWKTEIIRNDRKNYAQ